MNGYRTQIWWGQVLKWASTIALLLLLLFLLIRWLWTHVRRTHRKVVPEITQVYLEKYSEWQVPSDFNLIPLFAGKDEKPHLFFSTSFGVGCMGPKGDLHWFLAGRKYVGATRFHGKRGLLLTKKRACVQDTLTIELVSTEGYLLHQWRVFLPWASTVDGLGILYETPPILYLHASRPFRGEWLLLKEDGSIHRRLPSPFAKTLMPYRSINWPQGNLRLLGTKSGQNQTSGSGFSDSFWADLLLWGSFGHIVGRFCVPNTFGEVLPLCTPAGRFAVFSYGMDLGEAQWSEIYELDFTSTGFPNLKLLYRTPYRVSFSEAQVSWNSCGEEVALYLRNPAHPWTTADTIILLDTRLSPLDTLILLRPRGAKNVRGYAYWWIPDHLAFLTLKRHRFRLDPQWKHYNKPADLFVIYMWTPHGGFQKLLETEVYESHVPVVLDPAHGFLYLCTAHHRLQVYRVHLLA